MMRAPLILMVFCFLITSAWAQNGSEWVVYGQPYVKIPVGKNSIYRVTRDDLLSAGFPVSATDARKIQIFHRGIEQAITVSGESDNRIDPSDYVEFYGRGNDGTSDRSLYVNPVFQPNPFYSLFSDTTSYFLTAGSTEGKRIEQYVESASGLSPDPYVFSEKLLMFTTDFSPGADYGYIFNSSFDRGEGWMSSMVTESQPARIEKIPGLIKKVTTAPKPVIDIAFTGRGQMDHSVQIFTGPSSRLLTTVTVSGYETQRILHELEWSDITDTGELSIGFKVNIVNANSARVSLNYIKVRYAREADMNAESSATFNLRSNATGRSYLTINNFPPGTRVFDITDPSNVKQAGAVQSTNLEAVIKNTESERQLWLQSGYEQASLKKADFNFFDPRSYNYVIISHSALRGPALGYSDPVQAYADYRASAAGGNFEPLILDIHDLYDQFSYGEQTPLAIFNLMKYFREVKFPDYLFIIGKGLEVYYDNFRNPDQFPGINNLVPTAGLPASDVLFSGGLAGDPYVAAVPTGRITAMKPPDVAAYLNKVIESESRSYNDLTRKNILHLSGGIYTGEPSGFRSILEEFAGTAESFLLGGKVTAIAKQSTDIKTINVAKQVNEGVNLVTFFGHSAPGVLDFDIGKATDDVMGYKNKGKYPVLLMNGCDAGGFFLHYQLFGEDWMLAPDRGAIAFIAHSSYGYVGELKRYSDLFYKTGYTDPDFFTRGIGDIQKEVSKRYLAQTGTEYPGYIAQARQMMLMGDPALKLFGAPGPDYEIKDENISVSSLNEEPVTLASDSFSINFIVRNYGQAKNEKLHIKIIRTFDDRSTKTYDSLFTPVLYADTLRFIIKDKAENGFGDNTFEIRVDGEDAIDELREDNNTAYLDFFIPRNGTQNLYPGNYSIVGKPVVTLSFQHTDITSAERNFILEIDTVNSFSSPFKKQFAIAAKVLARREIDIPDGDTTVYFWRTKLSEPEENESREWTVSTFTFIKDGPEGWAQVDFQQFGENTVEGLIKDPNRKRLEFDNTLTTVEVKTFGALSGLPADSMSLKIDDVQYLIENWYSCRTNTINLVAFDRRTNIPYPGIPFIFSNSGGRACGRQPWVINSFKYNELITGNNDDIVAYVDNIETGDSVILYNYGDAFYELWPPGAKIKLEELGISVSQIGSLQPGEAVVICGRKGSDPGSAKFIRQDAGSPMTLKLKRTLTGRSTSGKMRSVTIGPARSWGSLMFRREAYDDADSSAVDVIGMRSNSSENMLYEGLAEPLSLTAIDPAEFRYLRLVYNVWDDQDLTPAQLDKWIVTFEPVPEGLIFYAGDREGIELQEGMTWTGAYGFVNFSDQSFDERLTIRTKITNHNSLTSVSEDTLIDPPAPGDTTLFHVTISTIEKVGLNDVEVYVNPQILPEKFYSNNRFFLGDHLNVTAEYYQPVLDVTIDGRYIENNEFVNPEPVIRFSMWDENRYLLKTDTLGIEMALAYPCDDPEVCPFRRIRFTRPDVAWSPASLESNFEVVFTPEGLAPGKYTLRISARDQAGNGSEDAYEISFMISDKEFFIVSGPYPNPAEREMNFDLIASRNPPDRVSLNITSLDGTLVHDSEHGLNNLHTGTNVVKIQTRDINGATLPSGIYLFRIRILTGTDSYERRGKVVIIGQ